MRRRDLLAMGGTIGLWPAVVSAQTKKARPLIGYLGASLTAGGSPLLFDSFIEGLGKRGYVDSRTIDIVRRADEFHDDRYVPLARDLLSLGADVIVTETPPGAVAAHQVTTQIPIVCPTLNEPVQLGLIASFSQPKSNVTGISTRVEGMSQKRLDILHTIVPRMKTVGLLMTPAVSDVAQRQDIESAAKAANVALAIAVISAVDDAPTAVAEVRAKGADALIMTQNSLMSASRDAIVAAAAQASLPTMFGFPEDVAAGALVSYGTDIQANFRRAAVFVDKILKGAKPAELPVEFPTRVILAINARTAKALGITLPESLLATADQVIE